ncbi:MAG TPA: hypothetical protein VN814_21725 [Caulobacteraceae bacterium]|nr:hypothetical protein [Caulobacteraceae bacterium]
MRRRLFLASLPLALIAGVASAAEPKAATGQNVDLAPVAMPIIVGGRLINYVFVYIRIDLTPSADAIHLRDKEPFFRDALVRLGHRTPFTVPTDYTKLDEARLKASFFQVASAIAGPGMVAAIEIMPGGGPMHRTGLPKPGTIH